MANRWDLLWGDFWALEWAGDWKDLAFCVMLASLPLLIGGILVTSLVQRMAWNWEESDG